MSGNRLTRREYALAMAALFANGGLAQDDQSVIRVDVDLVNILFTVRKKKGGALVPDLTKENFTIAEDNKPQTITRFNRESDLPLTIGLLIDISASQVNLIETERRAASAFFSSVIRPKDEAFLISFGRETELVQDLTSSARLLRGALDQMKGDISGGMVGGGGGGPIPQGPVPQMGSPKGTLMYDAVYLAANEKLKQEVGRKAMVLITDGQDQGSYYKREQAIEAAQRADAIIYSIYYIDPYFYSMYGVYGGNGDLKKMSEQTGGRVFEVNRKTSLEDVFAQIQEEMRNQYSIGYTPTNTKRDGNFRKIEIKVNAKDSVVQARSGYYATPGGGA